MGQLKDYFAFFITSALIIIPYWIMMSNDLISTSSKLQEDCMSLDSSQSLCISCYSKNQQQMFPQPIIQVTNQHGFKIIEQQQNSHLQCKEILQLIDYEKKIQSINDLSFEEEEDLKQIRSLSKLKLSAESSDHHSVMKRIKNFVIFQLKNPNEQSTLKIHYPSKEGNHLMRKFISIEAWAALFTIIIYIVLRIARGNKFQKQIFVNFIILSMILEQVLEPNNFFLLSYVRCLYIALCLSIINTKKIFVAIPMLLILIDNPLLIEIGMVLTLGIFLSQFLLNPSLTIYLNYLGSCLLILTINYTLMQFRPEILNQFPLQLIQYTVICTSTVFVEMLDSTIETKKAEGNPKTGPSLTGFEEITNEDQDF